MAGKRLGVGVIGAGRWANWAHLPGWSRDERCEIAAICDRDVGRALRKDGKTACRLKLAMLDRLAKAWNAANSRPLAADIYRAKQLIHRNIK